MPVPDIRRKEECGVLGAGTATRSCANNPAEKVTYLDPPPGRERRPPASRKPSPCPKRGPAKPRAVSQREAAASQTSALNELSRVRTEHR